jgi:hypothetical protein
MTEMTAMPNPIEIARADIMPLDEYVKVRAERRKAMMPVKRERRIDVGPHATFYFECYETMWHQIHEMLYIEKGGEEQIEDELTAYNPLIPKGKELVATIMFEIDDEVRRKNVLYKLAGIEETAFIDIDGDRVMSDPEHDVDRTSEDGKSSSVHFLHFPFTDEQIARFRTPGAKVMIGFSHENYQHLAVVSEAMVARLAADFA